MRRWPRTSAGTLRLEQDEHGVRFEAELGDDSDGRRAMAAVRAGALRGCSFGFRALSERDDGEDGITVVKARLLEVSLTGSPAYAAGGVWAADADRLPARLEHLREQFRAASRPRRSPGACLLGTRGPHPALGPQARAQLSANWKAWFRSHLPAACAR